MLSIDLGNGFTKVRAGSRRFSFPLVVSVEDETAAGFEELGLSGDGNLLIEYAGKRWAIGETFYTHGLLPIDDIITHTLPLTDFHAGMDRVASGTESIKVTLTP